MSKLRSAARRAALLTFSVASIVAGGCAQETPLLNKPLAWTPTNTLALGVTQSHGAPATVRFEAFSDTAADPALVGENVEHTPTRQVTTADPVGPFVTQHLQQLFAQAGYSGGADADRVISGDVRKFFVREGSDYDGSVVLDVTVSDRSGKALWHGTVWGTNQTFGRSYHLDNYQQVLSDSLIDAANSLLKSPAVRDSLTLN
ncbi:MAG TPA: hypothetical protein VHY36_00485 [Steroidobacteraceae bacterium]|nr:hypothetical protein [Steroidobacteraceae bacterium]